MEHPNDKMPGSEMMIYTTEDGLTKIETTFDGDTVWLSADQMAELFQRDKSTISRHIKNIFSEGELVRDSVVAKFATTAADGKTYQVEYYNLDVIISIGYRVKSKRGTQFRIWATGILKEYRMYDKIEDTESLLIAARAKKQAIEAEKLTGDNIYKVLIYFEKLYGVMNEAERRQLIEALISEIQIYPERQPNGQWLKSIKFKLPIIEEDMSISLDNEEQVETVVLLQRRAM